MNEAYTKKLVEDFPELYWQIDLPMNETAMCWGFDCGDGWFEMLYELSEKLQPLVQEINNKYEDWKFAVVQVKEKFGTLRYYTNGSTDEIDDLVWFYEELSGHVCDVCGKPGKLRGKGWYYTSCDEHAKERDES
jgi:hypothetical protein